MSTEQQQEEKAELDVQKRAMSSRRVRVALTIVVTIVFALLVIIAQVLGSLQIIPGIWVTISSAVAGVTGIVFAFIALLPVLFPSESQLQQIPHNPVQANCNPLLHFKNIYAIIGKNYASREVVGYATA